MTPEYGSTCTLFPVDDATLEYLRLTGRTEEQVALVEAYAKAQGYWHDPDAPARTYAEVIELDLGSVEPLARRPVAPARPHSAGTACRSASAPCAMSAGSTAAQHTWRWSWAGEAHALGHGALAIAAVTSCTTATDPRMMLACRPGGQEGRRGGSCAQAVGEDASSPRAARPPGFCSSAPGSCEGLRGAGLLHLRVRMHELHRQLRTHSAGAA